VKHLNFNSPPETDVHTCRAYRNGDWIVFLCDECSDYERRINWRTGEMKVKNARADVSHTGFYAPEEYREAFENVN